MENIALKAWSDLPKELWLLIIEQLPFREDLRALCLVSKALPMIVRPYLYRQIDVDLSDDLSFGRFRRSIAAGADRYLRFTKSLSLWDSPYTSGVRTPYDSLPSCLELHDESQEHCRMDDYGNDLSLDRIMKYFLEANLTTFRFISPILEIPELALQHLEQHRSTLQHLHLNTSLTDFVRLLTPQLQTLDLQIRGDFPEESYPGLFKELLSDRAPNLERIYLEFGILSEEDITPGVLMFQNMVIRQGLSFAHFKHLSELSFYRNDFEGNVALNSIPQLNKLRRLSIRQCWGQSEFLDAIGEASIATGSPLEHLHLECWGSGEYADSCLQKIYRSCYQLQSLHLEWSGGAPGYLLSNIGRLGPNLRSLSLYQLIYHGDSSTLTPENFRRICSGCPNLEQLGYQFPEDACLPEKWKEHEPGSYMSELESLRTLSQLRILHCRQKSYVNLEHANRKKRTYEHISSTLQQFANFFFGATPDLLKLRYLVWGSEGEIERSEETDHGEIIPQHCYVKGTLTEGIPGGRSFVTGVLTTPERIRDLEPDLDILQYDPGYIWDFKAQGRFWDD